MLTIKRNAFRVSYLQKDKEDSVKILLHASKRLLEERHVSRGRLSRPVGSINKLKTFNKRGSSYITLFLTA